MSNVTIDDLMNMLNHDTEEEKRKILKAYELASKLHHGQMRESGEPYIVHPLSVAIILASMHADADTICAGLLHDTIEDTNITKEDIAESFNKDVANLVDGVTKLAKMNFSSKEEQNLANTRKIITGITNDVRIIVIKLADRLHNMRTLEHKKPVKQKENALETLEIFVPLAYSIGAYGIKGELEDLSLRYLKPDIYKKTGDKIQKITELNRAWLEDMRANLLQILASHNIPSEIKLRIKNVYSIYKKMEQGHKLNEIHDLLALKIIVENLLQCYETLGFVHKEYHPLNSKFKDYICSPKTNKYQSLHTTIFGPNDTLVQTQIRTTEMDKIATYGLPAYWDIYGADAREKMQEELKSKYQFFTSLVEINQAFGDNKEFIDQVKRELFANRIYVYTTKGEIIELPYNATVIDFAYKIHTDIGNTMIGAQVNDEFVDVSHILKNKDRVKVLTDPLSFGPRSEWESLAKTTHARRRIREFNKK